MHQPDTTPDLVPSHRFPADMPLLKEGGVVGARPGGASVMLGEGEPVVRLSPLFGGATELNAVADGYVVHAAEQDR